MTAAPPVVADRYRLFEQLGVGGMGRVWRARDETLHRDVAVKQIVLPPELLDSARDVAMERTLREARAAARLSHPNVVRVYDVLAAEGQPWLVMEYVQSRSLDQVIRTDGPLPPRRVAEIGLAVLDALRAAHRAGVDHRDIKPGNVLLATDGRVVLTDFGIARVEGEGHVTRTGLVLGSPEFIAPERAREGIAGPASDLWSLGATLYAAVEGRSPFGRGSAMETLTALASEEADPPQRAGALAPALRALLRKDPRARADFRQTEELLRKAVIAPDTPPRKRSWLSGWGRGASSPAVPAQRPPRTRPESLPAQRPAPAGSADLATPGPATPGPADLATPGLAAGLAGGAEAPGQPEPGTEVLPYATPAAPVPFEPETAVEEDEDPYLDSHGLLGAESPSLGGISEMSGVERDERAEAGEGERAEAEEPDEEPQPEPEAEAEAEAEEIAAPDAEAGTPDAEAVQITGPDAKVAEITGPDAEVAAVAEPEVESVEGAQPEAEVAQSAGAAAESPAVAAYRAEAAAESEAATTVLPEPKTRVVAQPGSAGATRGATAPDVVEGPGRRSNPRRLALAGVGALVVVALLVWLAVKTDSSNPDKPGGAVQNTGAAAGPAPASSAAATTGAPSGGASDANGGGGSAPASEPAKPNTYNGTLPPLPDGWIDYHDPTGFSVYVPAGWRQSKENGIVYFRSGSGRTLGIDQADKPQPDPVADWTAQEQRRLKDNDFRNYHRERIEDVPGYFVKAADWEFTYDGSSARQHVNNRGLIASPVQAYGIWWQSTDADWAAAHAQLDLIFASFRPKQ